MKRYFIILLSILLPAICFGQGQIITKKHKIDDFTSKTTKVVISDGSFFEAMLEDAIKSYWKVSPYEFCNQEEFEKLKDDGDYYFLLSTQGQFKKENSPGIQMLTLVKGGTGNGQISDMLEIVSIPVASLENPSGRELIFLPALLDIIQEYTLTSMDREWDAYIGLSNHNSNLKHIKGHGLVMATEDIDSKTLESSSWARMKKRAITDTYEQTDLYLDENAEGKVVSYIVAPTDAQTGSYCYKMLIGTDDHKLYYFRKHRITERYGIGFLEEDIKRILSNL